MPGKNTVALYSVTGLLGSAIFEEFNKAHDAGKFNLVVITRKGSNTSHVPDSIEKRILNYGKSTQEETDAALKGVDILVSAVDKVSWEQHESFIDQVSKVKTLGALIPSDYAINWSKSEADAPGNTIVQDKVRFNDLAKQKGIPLAVIHNGLFAELARNKVVSGIDIQGNELSLYGDALHRKLPTTSVHYQGKALAELVAGDVKQLAGSFHTIIENAFTGEEIASELQKLNGAKPKITQFTEEEVKAAEQHGAVAVLAAQIRKKWGVGTFPEDGLFQPQGVKPFSVEGFLTGK